MEGRILDPGLEKITAVAALRDELTGALIGLARATDGNTEPNESTYGLLIRGLYATVADAGCDEAVLREIIDEVHTEKHRLVPGCAVCASPCGRNNDYDMADLRNAGEDVRSLKSLILAAIRGMAARAHRAGASGYSDGTVNGFIAKALFSIGEDWGMNELLPILLEAGEISSRCREILDGAVAGNEGDPVPYTEPLTADNGLFISPNVLNRLAEKNDIAPGSTPEEILKQILG